MALRLALPSPRFRRAIGAWAGVPTIPQGSRSSTRANSTGAKASGCRPMPTARSCKSLMQRVIEPGKMAGWIAPPDRGINNLPVEYEYVRL